MTCREFIAFLGDYFEKTLPEHQQVEFDRHLETCPYCRDYLASYQETIRLARATGDRSDGPPPPDAPRELIEAILAARRKQTN